MKRILFFHQGSFSNTNSSVQKGLMAQFPDAEIHTVNIHQLIKSKYGVMAGAIFTALWTYGADLVLRRRDLDDAFFSTRYIFNTVRNIAISIHEEAKADISFQTQSMFDCSFPGIPHFVYTDHTYLSRKEYPDYGRYIWASEYPVWLIDLERGIYKNAACVFAMSVNVENILRTSYDLPPSQVMRVGVGCNAAIANLAEISLRIDRYQLKNILFLGKAWERKGGPQLLEAFKIVREKHPDAKLTIAGCSPGIDYPGVRIIGRIPLEEVPVLFAEASIFCMPSRLEAFGIVFLEAMLAGLPVVALNLGAAPDFVLEGRTGSLVMPSDVNGLAGVLANLLDNHLECQRMGEAGRSLVAQNYTWEKVCATMASRMNSLCR